MTGRSARRSVGAVAAAVLLLAACSESSTEADSQPASTEASTTTTVADDLVFPGAEWDTVTAAEAGLDEAALDGLETFLGERGSNCMTVVRDGRLVAESYWNDTDPSSTQEMFSATKSMSSTVVGIAEEEGHLDIDQPASDFITEWKGTPSESVTIRNLLSNDSGRFWSFQTDYREMPSSADSTAFAIGLDQQFEPGTEWEYNNSAIQTLEAVVERATGRDEGEYAQEKLFEPIGMEVDLRRDPSGNPLTFMGADTTCQDLARFGLLFLAGGRWNDEQVVSEEWVAEATTPSTEINNAYGYLWWLNRPGPVELPGRDVGASGPIWPDLPENAYAAIGLGNQIVLVLPDEGIVVTRAGQPGADIGAQGNLVNEIGKQVLAAIE